MHVDARGGWNRAMGGIDQYPQRCEGELVLGGDARATR
jgi:hypothetical protein